MSAEQLSWTVYASPIGALTLIDGPGGLRSVRFPDGSPRPTDGAERAMPGVVAQLAEYFAGERHDFELALDLQGAPLQLRVWELLREIPYGRTTTYGELAVQIDDELYPDGLETHLRARVVGGAVGRTPTPIVVPCHRVIGADGSLTGYGGGLQRKRALLELEGVRVHGETGDRARARASDQLALL
ncbi:MAG: methylated-DNA--[protein]-cysteine S-methyltransferase [Solirubrobacteraceae bacterium]